MLKIGKTYYLKTWEELKKASNGDYSGALDYGKRVWNRSNWG